MVTRTKKIFVGGVSASTTEDDLTNYFKKFGTVSTRYKEKATIFENNTLKDSFLAIRFFLNEAVLSKHPMAPRNPLLPLGSKDILVLAQNVNGGDCEYHRVKVWDLLQDQRVWLSDGTYTLTLTRFCIHVMIQISG